MIASGYGVILMAPANTSAGQGALLKQELERIVKALRRAGAHKIILFGSYARGRCDAFTDLDLIVVQESELPFVERTAHLYRQLAPRVAVDFLVYTPQEWEEMRDRPFIQAALAGGKVLYEKGSC